MTSAQIRFLSWISLAIIMVAVPSSVSLASHGPRVIEVTMATPDVIGVIIHDPPFGRGQLVKVGPTGKDHGQWARHNGQWGRIVGRNRDHIRTVDVPPSSYLNRDAIDDASAYPQISGLDVQAVYRKSVPYDSGTSRSLFGATVEGASFKHYVYLKLSAALPAGSHRIVWPGDALPAQQFDYQDTETRAVALHVNQNGYAPNDGAKSGFLSLWLPGGPDHGQVDFRSYGLKTFQVRDDSGQVVHSGTITLRRGASDPEFGTGLSGTLVGYPSVSAPPRKAERLTFNERAILTVAGHGLGQARAAWFEGFSGALGHLNGVHAVSVKDNDNLILTELGNKIEGDWGAGSLGSVRPFYVANRAGTSVFELDFGGWKPENASSKPYHIYVPGLGVSDPFEVSEDVWLRAGRVAVAGLYNHRSGIPLDGRFGYTRPEAFGPNAGYDVVQSKLPLVFSVNYHDGTIPISEGPASEWRQADNAGADLWGGYMDAGDWDRRIQHLEASIALMDIFEFAGAPARQAELSLPASHEVLDADLYQSLADAPDLVHEIAWGLDFFRRLQLPDGRVRGGIESAEHPKPAEPSFLESHAVYVYGPDHVSGYAYAAAAAKFAGLLSSLDKSELADVYKDSALRAWSAAEAGFKDPDAFYADALKAAQAGGGYSFNWERLRTAIQKSASQYRTSAAGELFRLTGEQSYAEVFEAGWPKHGVTAPAADGAWAYFHAAGGKPAIKTAIRGSYARQARTIANTMQTAAFPALKHPETPAGWGQGLIPHYDLLQILLRAHVLSGDSKILDVMRLGSAHILGANPLNLSFTTGLGHRNILHPLHEDHRSMGVAAPKGITVYGWAPLSTPAYDWVFSADGGPLSDDGSREKRIEPFRHALPYFENLIEYPGIIVHQEYTIHQTIGTTAAMWLYLHAPASLPKPN